MSSKSFKLVLLGEGRVGKSSIGIKYTQGTFDPSRPPTVQAGFYSKKITTPQGVVELNLWDTAGQEEYHAVAPIYYKNAQAALLVYSVVNETSFDRMVHWHQELRQILGNSVKIFVVANKIDLPSRIIHPSQGVQYATSIGCNHFEVSAKTGEGLEMLFQCVTNALIKDAPAAALQRKPTRGKGSLQVLGEEEKQPTQEKGCC
jgi:small GTP-binding protein